MMYFFNNMIKPLLIIRKTIALLSKTQEVKSNVHIRKANVPSAYKLCTQSRISIVVLPTAHNRRPSQAQSLPMGNGSYAALLLVKTPSVLSLFFPLSLQYNRFLQAKAIKRVIRMLKTDVNKGNETVVRDEASRSHTLIKNPVGSK